MKIVNRLLIGIAIGAATNGLLWGFFCAIMLAFQEGLKKDLRNGWIFFVFLSFGFFGGVYGAIVGLFVSLIKAGKIVSAIGGGVITSFILFFITANNSSGIKNSIFTVFVFSVFTAFTCSLIIAVSDRLQKN